MKQKQSQKVVVNINQAKAKRKRKAKKSAKKKTSIQPPFYSPMPQSTIRYYDNSIPQRQFTISPPQAEAPKILKNIIPETEQAIPIVAERKPIKVKTPEPESEHVLLREEPVIELGGGEAPSARDVIEEERPVEPPEEALLSESTLLYEPPPSSASSLLSEPTPPPSLLFEAIEPFPLPPQQPPQARPIFTAEEWGGDQSEIRPVSFQIEERKGALRTLPPLSSARLLTDEEEGTGGIGIVPSGQDVLELFKRGKPAGMKPPTEPPTESPKTASGLASEPPTARQAEEVENEIEKGKLRKPRALEPEWYKLVKRDFKVFNLQQTARDTEESKIQPAEAKRNFERRKKAYRDTGQLVGFDISAPEQLVQAPLKRGFAEIGEKALGGGYSFVGR